MNRNRLSRTFLYFPKSGKKRDFQGPATTSALRWILIYHPVTTLLLAVVLGALFCGKAHALPEYAERSGQSCGTCHVEGAGGPLTEKGLAFAASGYAWPPEGGYRVLGPIRKPVRFVIGLFHITAAFIWFGTILYVHIMLRPAYASKGLPKGEVHLGMLSMLVVGVTGILLTVSRIRGLDILWTSPWGVVLLLKIVAYLLMIGSALFVVTWLGPRLRRRTTPATEPADGVFDPATLAAFDGKDGRAARIAHGGRVYDVSDLRLWRNGVHMKHLAGGDLSVAIEKAPHGPEMLERARTAGTFDADHTPPLDTNQKLFYVVAYTNLAFVFLVIGLIAWWRWGI